MQNKPTQQISALQTWISAQLYEKKISSNFLLRTKVKWMPKFLLQWKRTAGPICVSRFIKRNVACIASGLYAMVMCKFSPVFCICIHCKRNYEIDLI